MRNEDSIDKNQGGSDQSPLRARILVVEDDTALREITSRILDAAGYDVECAEDGEAAWNALRCQHYELIITDNNMPKVTGIDLLHLPHSARIETPVILMSGQLPTDQLKRSPELHIEAIIIKPYTESGLLTVVSNVLHGLVMGGVSGVLSHKQSVQRLKA